MKTYTGGCHCGLVRYEADADIISLIECNCSHCAVKSLLLAFVPASQFRLLSGEESLTDYQFNKHVIHHLFCRVCGVEAFGRGQGPDGTPTVALNVRTFDAIDLSQFTRMPFDGKSL